MAHVEKRVSCGAFGVPLVFGVLGGLCVVSGTLSAWANNLELNFIFACWFSHPFISFVAFKLLEKE